MAIWNNDNKEILFKLKNLELMCLDINLELRRPRKDASLPTHLWKDVDDGMPKDGETVLILYELTHDSSFRYYALAYHCCIEKWKDKGTDQKIPGNVLSWFTIPEKPIKK